MANFSKRLSNWTIIGFTVLYIAIMAIVAYCSTMLIDQEAERSARASLDAVKADIEGTLKLMEECTNDVAVAISQGHFDDNTLKKYCTMVVEDNPDIALNNITIVPESGQMKDYYAFYASKSAGEKPELGTLDFINTDYTAKEWFSIPTQKKQDVWTEPYICVAVNELVSSYSAPVLDSNGRLIAISTSDVRLEWIDKVLTKYRPYEHSFTTLVSRKGWHIGQEKLPEGYEPITSDEVGVREVTVNGEKCYEAYSPLYNGWTVCVTSYKSEMFASVKSMINILLIAGLLGLLLIYRINYRIIKVAAKPLADFSEATKEIASGKFNVTLPKIKHHDEIGKLRDSFEYMQGSLKQYIADLKETTESKAAMESELNIAASIQQGMLPKLYPAFPNVNEIDIFGFLKPAKEVGGDLFDYFIHNEKLFFCIGDVSGKGVPASLFMAVLRSLFRNVTLNCDSPSLIAKALNTSLSESNDQNMFCTMFIGVLDINTGKLHYTNAGHNAPVIRRVQGETVSVNYINPDINIAIGILDDFEFSEEETTLAPGEGIFLYTDGVTEAESVTKELYGEERLLKALTKARQEGRRTAKEFVDFEYNDIHQFAEIGYQSDDITMVLVEYKGK